MNTKAPRRPSQKLKVTAFAVRPDQLEGLQSLSTRTRVPQAVYVREALDALLKRYGGQK